MKIVFVCIFVCLGFTFITADSGVNSINDLSVKARDGEGSPN